MTNLAMLLLREHEVVEDFQILTFQIFFLIFLVGILLMIFLKGSVDQEEEEDLLTSEVQI